MCKKHYIQKFIFDSFSKVFFENKSYFTLYYLDINDINI